MSLVEPFDVRAAVGTRLATGGQCSCSCVLRGLCRALGRLPIRVACSLANRLPVSVSFGCRFSCCVGFPLSALVMFLASLKASSSLQCSPSYSSFSLMLLLFMYLKSLMLQCVSMLALVSSISSWVFSLFVLLSTAMSWRVMMDDYNSLQVVLHFRCSSSFVVTSLAISATVDRSRVASSLEIQFVPACNTTFDITSRSVGRSVDDTPSGVDLTSTLCPASFERPAGASSLVTESPSTMTSDVGSEAGRWGAWSGRSGAGVAVTGAVSLVAQNLQCWPWVVVAIMATSRAIMPVSNSCNSPANLRSIRVILVYRLSFIFSTIASVFTRTFVIVILSPDLI